MKILVTGGAGYIGAILVPRLLDAGHEVTVVDNFRYRENSLASVCYHPNFRVVFGDVRDDDLMNPLYAKSDAIIPLAALVGAPLCKMDPVGATTINRDAPIRMLKRLGKEQRVLMPITNSGYGVGESGKHCDENSPLRPLTLYAKDKVEVENRIMERGNAVSFRLATVFGMSPRMRTDLLVNDFTYRAVTDRFIVLFESHFKRNFIHVRDVTNAFMFALDHWDRFSGEVFNVGLSDANLSKKELCDAIRKQVPEFVTVDAEMGEDPDKRDYIVSNRKIEALGYRPQHSLDDGIAELIKGFKTIRDFRYRNT